MTWDENVSYLLHRYWLISEDLFCNLFILLHLLTPVHWICLLQLLKSLFLLLEHICGLYTSSNTLGSAATTSPVRPAMGGGICGWLFHSALISSCLADEACCTVTESSACVWVVNQWFHPFAPHLCFPPHEKHLRMTAQRKVVIALWVSVFVVFWMLNTDFCFCVTTFVHVRSRLSWREKQIIESVVPEVFRLYFVISQTGIRSTQTAEEFQECSFTCFRLMLTFIFFYSCSIDVCFLFALKSKFTLLHLWFFFYCFNCFMSYT